MNKQVVKRHEKDLKYSKQKAEREINQLIFAEGKNIVQAFVDQAKGGSYQHGAYLLDRAFGKARQNIGLDGGSDGAPIVFIPTALVEKFNLKEEPVPLKKGQVEIISKKKDGN